MKMGFLIERYPMDTVVSNTKSTTEDFTFYIIKDNDSTQVLWDGMGGKYFKPIKQSASEWETLLSSKFSDEMVQVISNLKDKDLVSYQVMMVKTTTVTEKTLYKAHVSEEEATLNRRMVFMEEFEAEFTKMHPNSTRITVYRNVENDCYDEHELNFNSSYQGYKQFKGIK